MKTKLLYGLATVSLLLSCQSNSFQINGIARALQEGDTICLAYDEEPESAFAQTTVSEGKFVFAGETDAFRLCRVYAKQQPDCSATFFSEPGLYKSLKTLFILFRKSVKTWTVNIKNRHNLTISVDRYHDL